VNDNDFLGLVATRTGMSSEQATPSHTAHIDHPGGTPRRRQGARPGQPAPGRPAGYASGSETAERFGLDVFVERVSGRADVDVDQARDGVMAVFDVFRDALGPAGYEQVITQLPAEYGDVADQTAPFIRRQA
jgi:hypothetical protein